MSQAKLYSQIFKSSSILGILAAFRLLLGMIQVKVSAIMIGVVGVGIFANYKAFQQLISTISGLGLQSSAVREITAAISNKDHFAVSRAILSLRRVCWITGLVGALIVIGFSKYLSFILFGNNTHVYQICIIGLCVLLGNIESGQLALIQGKRHLSDLAKANGFSAFWGTIITAIIYLWLKTDGIIYALLCVSIIQLFFSWKYFKKISYAKINMTWKESFIEAKGMVKLGAVFMWSGLMLSAVSLAANLLITNTINLESVGIYTAAFALSGIFTNVLITAMAADYYPHLVEIKHDLNAMNELANYQTEIALLISIPGLLATLCFAPSIIRIFYSAEFLPSISLLQWFILGSLFRVISWPITYIVVALGKNRWFFISQTYYNILHIGLIFFGLLLFGLNGVAIAYFLLFLFYLLLMYKVTNRITGFEWSYENKKLFKIFIPLFLAAFLLELKLSGWISIVLGLVITISASLYCIRKLIQCLGSDHILSRIVSRMSILN
jgi:PST family polysaccharide transporter